MRCHGPAVHLDQTAHQRQTDAQAAPGVRFPWFGLMEELKA